MRCRADLFEAVLAAFAGDTAEALPDCDRPAAWQVTFARLGADDAAVQLYAPACEPHAELMESVDGFVVANKIDN